ncbi:MAG TPA: hypothetical protein VER03_16575, partial [Bryobacteraceae bacterium]|nr:hypothetical protein [Bryobacteraceae bacterium]
ALAAAEEQGRIPSNRIAGAELAEGNVTLTLLEHDPRRFHGPLHIEFAMVALAAGVPDTANPAAIDVRAEFDLSAAGATPSNVVNTGAVDPARVPMLRLSPPGATAPYFPGAVIEIAGDTPAASLAVEEPESRRLGFLRGGLSVRIPATPVEQDRWFLVALDGSTYEAQTAGSGAADVPVTDTAGVRTVPRERLLEQGPGAAWPPVIARADPDPMQRIPNAPGRGPLILHGGRVLAPVGGASFNEVGAGLGSSLVFALRVGLFVPEYHPFLRLEWSGADPTNADWVAIDSSAAVTALGGRLGEIATLRQDHIDESRLLVRFECDIADARMTPCEIAWNGYDGESVLIYMPEMIAGAANPIAAWNPGAAVNGITPAVAVAADGSTWDETMAATQRLSWGDVAPLAEYLPVRRRVVRQRRLCGWINENPPVDMLDAPPAGVLDIDVENGLFALSRSEAIRAYPDAPEGPPLPPSVTVVYQDGYTDHTGARPAAREPLIDARLETPTRIVSTSGRLHRNAPPSWFAIPRYSSLTEAMADIAAVPASIEVIQFEDSATYADQDVAWPAGVDRLVIQAAERERPTILVNNWSITAGASYSELILLGLALGADADGTFDFPPAASLRVLYCTILREGMTLRFDLTGAAEEDRIEITRCITGGMELTGAGTLRISDSVVDAGHAPGAVALTAEDGELHLERCTVFGAVNCRIVHASETILENTVTVTDRFHGCVRYSRVTSDSVLPRIHRIVEDIAVKYVSLNRHDPAHARLAADADGQVLRGAEDGGEMGAFHEFQLALRYEGYRRRLEESTPAGLMTGVIRLD